MTGIAEMFDELSWRRDDYEMAIERWGAWRAAKESDRERRPERREWRREYMRRYRAEHPEQRAMAVERTRKWRAGNPDLARAMLRKSEKKRRERAKSDPAFRERYLRIRRESRARRRTA